MERVILYIGASLDGYIARPDGDVSWLEAYGSEDQARDYQAFYDSISVLVMGARTYEQVLGFGDWPYPDRRTYVLTQHRLPVPPGADVQFYAGGPEDLLRQVRVFTRGDVWLVGGARAAAGFLKAGLVDELRLAVAPVLLGEGLSLFSPGGPETTLELVRERAFSGGLVELTYRLGASGNPAG